MLGRTWRRLLVFWSLSVLPAAAVDVSLPDTSIGYGTVLVLPLNLADVSPDNIVSAEFDIAFDPQVFLVDSLHVMGTMQTWLADTIRVSGVSGDTLRFVGATATDAIAGDEVVLQLFGTVVDLRVPTTSLVTLPHVLLNDGSPTTTVDDGSITLVGDDAVVSASPSVVNLDGTITILVTDNDADVSGSVDQVDVLVTGNGDSETLQASETGGSTGIFSTSIDVVLGLTPIPGDGQLQAFASVDIDVCHTDDLDASGSTVERCDAVVVFGGDDGVLTATVVMQPGDTLHIRLEDTDLIADDTTDVAVHNGRSGESEALRLPQTAAQAGFFFSSLITAFGATGPDDDGVLLAQEGDTLWVSYSDAFTALGDTGSTQIFTMTVDPLGDASGNGNVRGFDASLILEHSVGAVTLSGRDSLAANLDQQAPFGPITAFDASLVLQHRVGLLPRFPIQQKDADNHPQPEAGASSKRAPVFVPVALEASEQGWRVVVDGDTQLLSGHLVLDRFDGDIVAGEALHNALLTRFDPDTGTTRVAFASAAPMQGSLEILQFSGADAPQIREITFNGGQALGRVRPGSAPSVVAPSRFILRPAMPNPFNPTTHIRYELKEASHAHLVIVNALGQQVRTLVNTTQTAGSHSVVWDGRSDHGQHLAAGTYFHHLRANGHAATGKMVLAK